MTIRYTCNGCESVLKIKDEKAGTNGKCPKCKMEFVIPFPAEDDGIEVAVHKGSKTSAPVDAPVDDVDMPIELTPEVEDRPDFDPLDVLSGPATTARSPETRTAPSVTDKKPSVAELMRDFEAGKKKDRKKDSAPDISGPAATATATADQTAGSAANALSRAYQQKRDSANAPRVSAKDVEAAEQRAMLMEFLKKKAGPVAAALVVFLSAYYWYLTREVYSGLPLFPVHGKLISKTEAVDGLRIQFMPVIAGPDDPRSSAEGVTTEDGSFDLIYMAPFEGAPAGKYEIIVYGKQGAPLSLPEGTSTVTVSDSNKNDFEINL